VTLTAPAPSSPPTTTGPLSPTLSAKARDAEIIKIGAEKEDKEAVEEARLAKEAKIAAEEAAKNAQAAKDRAAAKIASDARIAEAARATKAAEERAEQEKAEAQEGGKTISALVALSPIQAAPKSGIFGRKEAAAYQEYNKIYNNMKELIKLFNRHRTDNDEFIADTTKSQLSIVNSCTRLIHAIEDKDNLANNAREELRKNKGIDALKVLNLKLNKTVIPNLNKVAEIFNSPENKFVVKLGKIKENHGLIITDSGIKLRVQGGGGNRTRSKRNRSNRKTIKLRFIY
jgi:hypothetical protein